MLKFRIMCGTSRRGRRDDVASGTKREDLSYRWEFKVPRVKYSVLSSNEVAARYTTQ